MVRTRKAAPVTGIAGMPASGRLDSAAGTAKGEAEELDMMDRHALRGSLERGGAFLGLWLILSGFQPADLLVGILAAGIATWASLRLLPLGQWRFQPRALAAFGLRFLGQSVSAGIDVAWRAFTPRPSLQPGFVAYRPRLLQGQAQTVFCTVMSLVPGTLPSGLAKDGDVVIHCLDVEQPVVAQSAVEEKLLARAFGVPLNDG